MSIKEKPFRGSTKQPGHIMISLNGDAASCMAVTWRCCTDVTSGYVLYRQEGGDWRRKEAVFEPFVSDIDESNVFWCHLTGLESNTKYYYTCGNDEYRSDEFSFSTSPENLSKFKFLCIADHQKGGHEKPDYSWFNTYFKNVLKQHPDARFILTGGDNTDCGQHEVQWNGLFDTGLAGICESIPLMMSLGNHDNRGFSDYALGTDKYYSEPAEFFSHQFKGSYPDNGPDGWKTENYTFDYGNAHISVVGINGPEDVNRWMINDLSRTKQKWKLGVYHFPICYSGTDCENYDAYPDMREGFELFDLVFSGHEHNFSRSFPLKNEELFEKPSQGTVHYMLGNSNQNPPGSRTVSKVWHAAFFPQEEDVACVCIVEVDGDTLTLTSVLNDSRIVDKCVIDKAKDEIQPYALPPQFNRTRMMYKGMDPGLCQVAVPCELKDGVWCCALATLIAYIGGEVSKDEGAVTLELYGHKVTFTENSNTASTEKGEFALPCKVYRSKAEQLYIPAEGCKAFGMRWAYSPRNNFLSFEHPSNAHPFTRQP